MCCVIPPFLSVHFSFPCLSLSLSLSLLPLPFPSFFSLHCPQVARKIQKPKKLVIDSDSEEEASFVLDDSTSGDEAPPVTAKASFESCVCWGEM